jgi:O-methyltransferase involved in polyketide biosynthesis
VFAGYALARAADEPASQAAKRRALRLGGVAIPVNVASAEIDFERTALRDAPAASGLDLAAPIFFSWLGVTVSLTRAAVEATLLELAHLTPGSEVAFTFAQHAFLDGEPAIAAAAAGEPWLTAFEKDELCALLERCAFSAIDVGDSWASARV